MPPALLKSSTHSRSTYARTRVERDGLRGGRGAHDLDVVRPDLGQRGRPAVAGVAQAVEEDEGGRVLAPGGEHHGVAGRGHAAVRAAAAAGRGEAGE